MVSVARPRSTPMQKQIVEVRAALEGARCRTRRGSCWRARRAQAERALAQISRPAGAPGEVAASPGAGAIVRLKDGRLLLALAPRRRPRCFRAETLARGRRARWRWLDIRSGLPLVTAATQDQFIPQMANLELIGGVSFEKGCYTGQEVVARTQHLGKVKRRMFLANVAASGAGRGCDSTATISANRRAGW